MRNNKAKSFVVIMVIIAISSLLLRFAIEQIMKVNITQNESNASATLKLISTALENYAKNNQDVFPASLEVLTQTNPAYLDKNYNTDLPIKGYNYSCSRLEPSGYSCSANPVRCQLTGRTVYTVTTGGFLINETCAKKE